MYSYPMSPFSSLVISTILENADVIWDSQNQSLKNKLENVQLDAATIVTGGTQLTGLNRLYEETIKWEKVSDRRQNHKLIIFHKIKNNRTPQYLFRFDTEFRRK